ncbi:MAG TPA: fibronectin type III domain-containing protein [Fimbriimonadaceae bacterium]|nr:fibronectin type III domain-containing protein [Fimbriimonadaceae bacterium]
MGNFTLAADNLGWCVEMNHYRESLDLLARTATTMRDDLTVAFADYGLTAAQATALSDAVNQFVSDRFEVEAKRAEFRSAVEAQRASRHALLSQMGQIAAAIYNNPAVTPAMIAELGLVPRDTKPTKAVPRVPQNFFVVPSADGSVALRWNRSGNSKRVTFVVETRRADGDWSVLTITNKTKVKSTGFPPGEEAWFRVYATVNDRTSPPSASSTIYPSGSQSLAA